MIQMPDKEHVIVTEMLQLLDSHNPNLREIMTVLLNLLAFIALTGVDKEQREECILLFISDMPDAINYLADQLGLSFDWEKFKSLKDDYHDLSIPKT
jgi:hypothetical protein